MPSYLIATRFDLIVKASNKSADKLLGWADLPFIPDVGELVNFMGDPYIIHTRGWAVVSRGEGVPDGDPSLFCYLRVTKAGDF